MHGRVLRRVGPPREVGPQVDQLVVVLGGAAERDTGKTGMPVQGHVELDRAVAERRVAQQRHAIVDEEGWTFEVHHARGAVTDERPPRGVEWNRLGPASASRNM